MRTNATPPRKPPRESAQHRHVLHVMTRLHGWESLAEVGVWKGDTGAYLLEMIPDLRWVGVDPYVVPEGSMDEPGYCSYGGDQEKMEVLYGRTRDRFSVFGDRASLLRVSSVEAAESLGRPPTENAFDCVFIDGDHRSEHVERDVHAWRTLVRSGGWLCGHDYDMPSVKSVVDAAFGVDVVDLPDRTWAVRL